MLKNKYAGLSVFYEIFNIIRKLFPHNLQTYSNPPPTSSQQEKNPNLFYLEYTYKHLFYNELFF